MFKALPMLAGASGVLLVATGVALAQQLTVDMNSISESGVGDKVGTVVLSGGKKGVSFKVSVKNVPPGKHGFHVHDKGDCASAAKDGKMTAGLAAGPHYDPDSAKSHKGPTGKGHKGDLPVLTATAKGINQTVRAPRLNLSVVQGRALMIHEGGDNYSDTPENGGGKGRI
ncbi:MAG TPA: superoxide dismutase family protein, partial [Hyphomicrobiaceae bacterium]|nr:superoxide dismutase family protein [Hyphomicrobiaceae bacterium]